MTRFLFFVLSSVAIGTISVVASAFRYGKRSDARSYMIAAPIVLFLVVVITAGTDTYELRCPDDPREYCTYNDFEPIILLMATGFLVVAMIKSWKLYTER